MEKWENQELSYSLGSVKIRSEEILVDSGDYNYWPVFVDILAKASN